MTPNPALLSKLTRSKLVTRWQTASVGVGERRSNAKGSGMEFADHREYHPGDDFRHLDVHLHARFGKNYVREYDVYRQLPITILVDGSRSMDFGTPNKFEYACNLAALMGFIGLAGGDQVQVGIGAGERIHWSPKLHGAQRAQALFNWMSGQKAATTGAYGTAVRESLRHLTNRGLIVLISDWWTEGIESEIRILNTTGNEVWGMHVTSREEMDPSALGEGEVRLVDHETGHEVEVALDRSTRDRYVRSLEAWREQLQSLFTRANGRYLLVPTDQPPERLFLQDWRKMGMIA